MTDDSRTLRFVGRHALRSITTDLRCYDCGREPIGKAVEFRRTPEGVAGIAGLASCGRVWLCPVCNAKVMARRALEIGVAVAWAESQSYVMLWGSLTVRHNARSNLADLLDIQRNAWRSLVREKFWAKGSATATVPHTHSDSCAVECDRKQQPVLLPVDGRVGYIRAAELTTGRNGWHPHFHPLIIWRGDASDASRFAERTVAGWIDGVEASGGEARENGAQQLEVLRPGRSFKELGAYVTKQTYDAAAVALELVWSQGKTKPTRATSRRAKTEAHWGLLAGIAAGVVDDVDTWHQLEDAIPGHRMITWSRGLREFAGVGAESTDEDIAAEELGSRRDAVCFVTPEGWNQLRDLPEVLGLMLSTLETSGWAGLRILLDGYGIEYVTPDQAWSLLHADYPEEAEMTPTEDPTGTTFERPMSDYRPAPDYVPDRYSDPAAHDRFWAQMEESGQVRPLRKPVTAALPPDTLF